MGILKKIPLDHTDPLKSIFSPKALSALAELFLGLFLLIPPSAAVPFRCHYIIYYVSPAVDALFTIITIIYNQSEFETLSSGTP